MNAMTINYVHDSTGSIGCIEKDLLAAVVRTLDDHGAELSSVQFEECTATDPAAPKEIQLFGFMTGRG